MDSLQMKDYDMALAKKFCEIAQAVVSRPNNILSRVEKANDKVDFSSGRFQEIAIDIESISEDISSKNFDSMETLENMFTELLKASNAKNKFFTEQMAFLKEQNILLSEQGVKH